MYILDKLKQQIQNLKLSYSDLLEENSNLQKENEYLKDQLDQLTYNNENMLLNIDRALDISKEDTSNG